METVLQSAMERFTEIFTRNGKSIAVLMSIIVIALMGISVARTTLLLIDVSTPSTIGTPTSTGSINQPREIYRLSDVPLFGMAEQANTLPEIIDAPETRLNLELQGVFIADNKDRSTAIVAEKNKTGELFAIGDRLPGNATLESVHVDHVLLRRGSRLEKLMFSDSAYRSSSTAGSASTMDQPRSSGASRVEQLRERLRNNVGSQPDADLDDGTNPRRQALNNYQQKLKEDPVSALSEVGVAAVSEGESKGYRIGDDAQSEIRQAGLQPGDVILSINGRAVGNAASDAELMGQVMRSTRVRVEVQRGKRRFFLTVPVPK